MKAITKRKYGGPEVLQLEEVDLPVIKNNEILVKVKANSANPADWHLLRGKPNFVRLSIGLFKPKQLILGADFAGVVEEVGSDVKDVQKGDNVFGESSRGGAFAEYTAIKNEAFAKMPNNISFTEMASVPIAGLTALQAVKTHGKIQKDESILINGSSGGVGHFAVQIAKVLGAEVTAVCSSKNEAFVRSIGADHVIAYNKENIHNHEGEYDLVLDNHGNLFHSDYKRMGKRGVMVGFTGMGHMMRLMFQKTFNKFPLKSFTAQANKEDLQWLSDKIGEGQIKVHIEKTFPYQEIPEAVGYIEDMRTRGKVAMSWE